MINAISSITDNRSKVLVCLKHTRFIDEDCLQHEQWATLKHEYGKVNTPIGRALCSIVNSILFQQRVYFSLTRADLREMVTEDRNHVQIRSFKNETYSKIRALLFENGIAEEVFKGTGKQVSILKIVDKNLLKYLKVNVEAQKEESLIFFNGLQGDRKRDQKGDLVTKYLSNIGKNKLLTKVIFNQIITSFQRTKNMQELTNSLNKYKLPATQVDKFMVDVLKSNKEIANVIYKSLNIC